MRDWDQAAPLARKIVDEAAEAGLALPESMAWGTLAAMKADGADVGMNVPTLGMLAIATTLSRLHRRCVARAGITGVEAQFEATPTTCVTTIAPEPPQPGR